MLSLPLGKHNKRAAGSARMQLFKYFNSDPEPLSDAALPDYFTVCQNNRLSVNSASILPLSFSQTR